MSKFNTFLCDRHPHILKILETNDTTHITLIGHPLGRFNLLCRTETSPSLAKELYQHIFSTFSDFFFTVSEPFPHYPDEIEVVFKFPGKSSLETNTKTPSLTPSDSSFSTTCTLDAQEYYFEGIDPPREKTPPSTLPPLFPPTEGQPFSSSAVPTKLPPLDSPTVPSNPAPVPLSKFTPPTDPEYYTIIVQMQQMLAQQAEELAHLRRSLYQHQQITSTPR
jgi:hypothetical protein